MNTCDDARVAQIRKAVREQAQCDLPAFVTEQPFQAVGRWVMPWVTATLPMPVCGLLLLGAIAFMGRRFINKRSSVPPRMRG